MLMRASRRGSLPNQLLAATTAISISTSASSSSCRRLCEEAAKLKYSTLSNYQAYWQQHGGGGAVASQHSAEKVQPLAPSLFC